MKNKVWEVNVIGERGFKAKNDFIIGSNDEETEVVVQVGDALVSQSKFKALADGELGTKVVANPEGEVDDKLNKIQIGDTLYEIEGGGSGEGFLQASNTEEMEALLVEENQGKYVKYVGGSLSVDSKVEEPAPYKSSFDTNAFLEKIEHTEFNKTIVYDGATWKHGDEEINLSEYGVNLYNGTPETMPVIGSKGSCYCDTTYMPTAEDIDAAIAAGGELMSVHTFLSGEVEMTLKFTHELYQGEGEDPMIGHFIVLTVDEGDDTMEAPLFARVEEEFEWDLEAASIAGMYMGMGNFTSVSDAVYATCKQYISPYEFPHTEYVPESDLVKLNGDTVKLVNHVATYKPLEVGPFDGKCYAKFLTDEDFIDILWGTQNCDVLAAIDTEHPENGEYIFYVSYNSCGDDFCDYYLGIYNDTLDIDETLFYFDVPEWMPGETKEITIPANQIIQVDEEHKEYWSKFIAATPAFVEGEQVDLASMEIAYAPRIGIILDEQIFAQKAGTDAGKLVFNYINGTWTSGANNTAPITKDDEGTTIDTWYINTHVENIDDLIKNYQNTTDEYYLIENCLYAEYDDDWDVCYIMDDYGRQIYSSQDVNYGSTQLRKGWMKVDADGKCTFSLNELGTVNEDGLPLLEAFASKAPFEYTAVDLAEYGITISGAPAEGDKIIVTVGPGEYEQYRLYTVKPIVNGNNFGYEYAKTYATPEEAGGSVIIEADGTVEDGRIELGDIDADIFMAAVDNHKEITINLAYAIEGIPVTLSFKGFVTAHAAIDGMTMYIFDSTQIFEGSIYDLMLQYGNGTWGTKTCYIEDMPKEMQAGTGLTKSDETLAINTSNASNGQVLTYNNNNVEWTTVSAGGAQYVLLPMNMGTISASDLAILQASKDNCVIIDGEVYRYLAKMGSQLVYTKMSPSSFGAASNVRLEWCHINEDTRDYACEGMNTNQYSAGANIQIKDYSGSLHSEIGLNVTGAHEGDILVYAESNGSATWQQPGTWPVTTYTGEIQVGTDIRVDGLDWQSWENYGKLFEISFYDVSADDTPGDVYCGTVLFKAGRVGYGSLQKLSQGHTTTAAGQLVSICIYQASAQLLQFSLGNSASISGNVTVRRIG